MERPPARGASGVTKGGNDEDYRQTDGLFGRSMDEVVAFEWAVRQTNPTSGAILFERLGMALARNDAEHALATRRPRGAQAQAGSTARSPARELTQ
jgi:hypothetical protein